MRQMSQISISNYLDKVEPKLTKREAWVLEAIEDLAPASAEIVAEHLGVFPNVVSGRFTGLRKKGKIVKAFEQVNARGSKVAYWQPNEGGYEYTDIA